MQACWLSHEERVEVVGYKSRNKLSTYAETQYRALRTDGSMVLINRKDILLEDEEKLIDELASILKVFNNPTRSERYGLIFKSLMKQGTPFHKRLEQRLCTDYNQQLRLEF